MITAGSGLHSGDDPVRCAASAARAAMSRIVSSGQRRADAVLVFTSGNCSGSVDALLGEVASACGTDNIAGCSGAGVLTEAGEIEGDKAVAVMALCSGHVGVKSFFVGDLKGRDRDVGIEIGRRVADAEDSLLLIFPDTLACNPDSLFDGILESAGATAVAGGGAASHDGTAGKTFQFHGTVAETNGVSGILLQGAVTRVSVTQACLPIGKPMRVTGAMGNAIKSLDGVPAVKALLSCLSGSVRGLRNDLHRLAPHLFIAFPTAGAAPGRRAEYFVRNILGVDPDDGAIYVGHEIAQGETVSFALRDPDGAREDLKAMLEESTAAAGQPALGLYFNCCARGHGLYGVPNIDTSYISNAYGRLPVAGFFGFAEIASSRGRARLHNHSGVMVLVSEALAASGNGFS